MLLITDTSHFEPPIDWVKAKALGVVGNYTKASEGSGSIDSMLHQHTGSAKAAGLYTGAYHFLRASCDYQSQVNLFMNATKGMTFDFPPILDWELSDGQSAKVNIACAGLWLDAIENKTGRTPVLYGGESFLRSLNLPDSFARYPLILAHYGVPTSQLNVPSPWKEIWAHQFTDSYSLPGALQPGHTVDANWYVGDADSLALFVKNNT